MVSNFIFLLIIVICSQLRIVNIYFVSNLNVTSKKQNYEERKVFPQATIYIWLGVNAYYKENILFIYNVGLHFE